MGSLLSIEEQIVAMKATWPMLLPRNVDHHLQSARWVGKVRAQHCWYTIDIRYRLGSMPEVRIISPTLVRLPDNVEGQLPHVYPPADDPTLCLFDPRTGEWNGDGARPNDSPLDLGLAWLLRTLADDRQVDRRRPPRE